MAAWRSSLLFRSVSSPLQGNPLIFTGNRHQWRSFSASRPARFSMVEAAVAAPTALLDSIHSLGVPYYAAIPVAAVLVRGTFVYYFSTRPMRRDANIRSFVTPLVAAQLVTHQNTPEARRNANRLARRSNGQQLMKVQRAITAMQFMGAAGKVFGARGRGWMLALNFGTLITFAEAIRMKCGITDGLLRLMATSMDSAWRKLLLSESEPSAASKTLSADELLAQRLEKARELELQKMGSTSEAETLANAPYNVQMEALPLVGPDVDSPYFDPLVQTEGLFWCPDLTLPDPTYTLPLSLMSVFVFTLLVRPAAASTLNHSKSLSVTGLADSVSQQVKPVTESRERGPFFASLTLGQRLGLSFSILFGMAAVHMPAAILLYLIPSILTGWVQSRYLDFKHPIARPIRPCSRPMRMRAKPLWGR